MGRPRVSRTSESGLRECPQCHRGLPATTEFFTSQKSHWEGLNPWCKECWRLYQRERRKRPDVKESMRVSQLKYYQKNPRKAAERDRQQRMEVMAHYSGGSPRCSCCGEDRYEFLAIDHEFGGGTQHKKQEGYSRLYQWLRKNDYPDGYRVLCHNCNSSLGHYGYCPHSVEMAVGA